MEDNEFKKWLMHTSMAITEAQLDWILSGAWRKRRRKMTNEEANVRINKSLEVERMKGKVRWFNDKKGYGFIESEDGKDVFLHYGDIMMKGHKTIQQGDSVEFEIENAEKGMCARKVKKV